MFTKSKLKKLYTVSFTAGFEYVGTVVGRVTYIEHYYQDVEPLQIVLELHGVELFIETDAEVRVSS